MRDLYLKIIQDPRYQRNICYGKARKGHPEATVAAHIAALEGNLQRLFEAGLVSQERFWRLRVLIHVHDSFKAEAVRGCAILAPDSHASLARAYLAEKTDDADMLNVVQFHDLGFSVYRAMQRTGFLNEAKLMRGLTSVGDIDLFVLFVIVDNCATGKDPQYVRWFVDEVNRLIPRTTIGPEHISAALNFAPEAGRSSGHD